MKEVDIISKVVGRDTSGKAATFIPGAGAPSVNLDDYLLKKIWDSVFEIRTDSEGNPYLFEKMPFVTQYGITMYADGGELDLPSIYAGLPIDGSTLIRDGNGVLMINPDIDLGGGASTWDELIGKPSWIGSTKPSYNYSEILQTPDLSVYALAKDLEKYVTLNTEQTIAAHKNFLNGLSVGGLGITKSQDDVVYIDANLVVRGGITMYATDTVDVPSIIDSLPIASTSAKGLASFDPNFFSVDDNGYVSFIGSTGVDESVLADYAKKTDLSAYAKTTDLSAYLPLNGGQMTGNIGYTLSPDSYGVGIPASGSVAYSTSRTEVASNSKTFIGSILDNNTNFWYNMISVRHQNGNPNADGAKYGMYIYSDMTHNNYRNLIWNQQFNGVWQGERVILDSVNWSQYVTAANGGSYLPLTGGTLSGVLVFNENSTYTSINSNGSFVVAVRGERIVATESDKFFPVAAKNNLIDLGSSNNYWRNLYANGVNIRCSNVEGITITRQSTTGGAYVRYNGGGQTSIGWIAGSSDTNDEFMFQHYNGKYAIKATISKSGDILAYGGITMYSDIRKKTKLQDVELSLKQIADAPLIEHYYNSDSNKTTHVGSIAQYWAGLNDWFCKLDSEGFYTMEIQNAALASAISIARELTRYESKTDRTIRKLKQRISELEDKIEKLENN